MANNDLSPYICAKQLTTKILLHPCQMNNDIYTHIKNNVKQKLEHKCFGDFGYIKEIYSVYNITGGLIRQEDTEGNAEYEASFECKLFVPNNNKQIICKMTEMKTQIYMAENGPLRVIIQKDINKDKFLIHEGVIRIKNTNEYLKTGAYVKITILNYKIHNGDKMISSMGRLDDIATDKEIQMFENDLK